MDLQGVAFLPPTRASFSTTFLIIVLEVKASGPPPSLKTVVVGIQGHALCRVLFLTQSLFLCQLSDMETIRLSQS